MSLLWIFQDEVNKWNFLDITFLVNGYTWIILNITFLDSPG